MGDTERARECETSDLSQQSRKKANPFCIRGQRGAFHKTKTDIRQASKKVGDALDVFATPKNKVTAGLVIDLKNGGIPNLFVLPF